MKKNLDPVQKFFIRVAGKDCTPNSNFLKLLEMFEMSQAKLIFGLQVNIDKANSHASCQQKVYSVKDAS